MTNYNVALIPFPKHKVHETIPVSVRVSIGVSKLIESNQSSKPNLGEIVVSTQSPLECSIDAYRASTTSCNGRLRPFKQLPRNITYLLQGNELYIYLISSKKIQS